MEVSLTRLLKTMSDVDNWKRHRGQQLLSHRFAKVLGADLCRHVPFYEFQLSDGRQSVGMFRLPWACPVTVLFNLCASFFGKKNPSLVITGQMREVSFRCIINEALLGEYLVEKHKGERCFTITLQDRLLPGGNPPRKTDRAELLRRRCGGDQNIVSRLLSEERLWEFASLLRSCPPEVAEICKNLMNDDEFIRESSIELTEAEGKGKVQEQNERKERRGREEKKSETPALAGKELGDSKRGGSKSPGFPSSAVGLATLKVNGSISQSGGKHELSGMVMAQVQSLARMRMAKQRMHLAKENMLSVFLEKAQKPLRLLVEKRKNDISKLAASIELVKATIRNGETIQAHVEKSDAREFESASIAFAGVYDGAQNTASVVKVARSLGSSVKATEHQQRVIQAKQLAACKDANTGPVEFYRLAADLGVNPPKKGWPTTFTSRPYAKVLAEYGSILNKTGATFEDAPYSQFGKEKYGRELISDTAVLVVDDKTKTTIQSVVSCLPTRRERIEATDKILILLLKRMANFEAAVSADGTEMKRIEETARSQGVLWLGDYNRRMRASEDADAAGVIHVGEASPPSLGMRAQSDHDVSFGEDVDGLDGMASPHHAALPVANVDWPVQGDDMHLSSVTPSHAGIVNLGATCYASVVLQMLFCMPGFVELLGNHLPYFSISEECHVSEVLHRCLLQMSKGGAVFPDPLFFALQKAKVWDFHGQHSGEQDPHEFFVRVLTCVRNELDADIFQKFLEFEGMSVRSCVACKRDTRTRMCEFTLELQLPQESDMGIENCVRKNVERENMSYTCEWCGCRCSSKKMHFENASQVLVVSLKRFNTWNEKVFTRVALDATISLAPFFEKDKRVGRNYRLIGVVNHIGENMQSFGHYVAFVRESDRWLLCNDGTVSQVSFAGVCASQLESVTTASFLVYEKVADESGSAVAEDGLFDVNVGSYASREVQHGDGETCVKDWSPTTWKRLEEKNLFGNDETISLAAAQVNSWMCPTKNCVFCETYLFERFVDCGFPRVSKWVKKWGADCSLLCVPVHVGGSHFVLAVVIDANSDRPRIVICDDLGRSCVTHEKVAETVLKLLLNWQKTYLKKDWEVDNLEMYKDTKLKKYWSSAKVPLQLIGSNECWLSTILNGGLVIGNETLDVFDYSQSLRDQLRESLLEIAQWQKKKARFAIAAIPHDLKCRFLACFRSVPGKLDCSWRSRRLFTDSDNVATMTQKREPEQTLLDEARMHARSDLDGLSYSQLFDAEGDIGVAGAGAVVRTNVDEPRLVAVIRPERVAGLRDDVEECESNKRGRNVDDEDER